MAKLTVDQFAQQIKDKYPEYAGVDNNTLVQKMLAKYPTYQDRVESPQIAAATVGAPPGAGGTLKTAADIGGGILNGVRAFGEGVGSTILNTGLGLGGIASKGVGLLAGVMGNKGGADFYGKQVPEQLAKIGPAIANANPGTPERIASLPGMAGSLTGDIATLAEGTPAVNAGKAALAPVAAKATSLLSKVPAVGKVAGSIASRVLAALPEAGVGFGFGKTQGQTNTEALGTAAGFGALSGLGEVAGDLWRAYKGNIADNVGRAIGMTGKMNATAAQQKIPKAINALSIINGLAPDIKVVDTNGIEKQFNPSNATFGETLQAWTKARDQIYQAYTELATQAGDKGAQFTHEDFSSVVDAIKAATKDSTSAFKNKAASLIHDISDNFGTYDPKTGDTTYEAAPFDRVQSFLEKVNTDVNPLSDKAAAEVSATASKEIRKILDDKIAGATGGGYQKLRNAYGDLKSIEGDLVNQFKKSARHTGTTVPAYLEGFGAIDLIAAALTGNVMHAARGAGELGFGVIMKNLKDPEKALRRAFQQMGPARPPGAAATRAFGAGIPQAPIHPTNIEDLMKNPATKPGATSPPPPTPTGAPPMQGKVSPAALGAGAAIGGAAGVGAQALAHPAVPTPTPVKQDIEMIYDPTKKVYVVENKATGQKTEFQSRIEAQNFVRNYADQGGAPVVVRGAPVTPADVGELKNVLYAEISNRPPEKQKLEARVIVNTALNRLAQNIKSGKGPQTLVEVLQQPNQYQGYDPTSTRIATSTKGRVKESQYSVAKAGKGDPAKMAAIEAVLAELQSGNFADNTNGAFYYMHNPGGSITYDDKRKLYQK